jgi:ribosomal protein S20
MLKLLRSPYTSKFRRFIDSLDSSCCICSPYITAGPMRRLVNSVEEKRAQDTVTVKIITDISAGNIVQGSTDIEALIYLIDHIRQVEIVYLPKVHAKVYISGDSLAIISSANFTDGGTFRNLEYGVQIDDPPLVRQVTDDVTEYARLGSVVNLKQLSDLRSQVKNLRSIVQSEQRSINKKLRVLSAELQRTTEDNLIRIRTSQRTSHAIFADTILYLLTGLALTTIEINEYIREIHPDLCDDRIDRIIDGKHFGKFWKHQVRSAQVYLKRKKAIEYDSEKRLWQRRV